MMKFSSQEKGWVGGSVTKVNIMIWDNKILKTQLPVIGFTAPNNVITNDIHHRDKQYMCQCVHISVCCMCCVCVMYKKHGTG